MPYTDLPEIFYTRMAPSPVQQPRLILFNEALAQQIGLSDLIGDEDRITGLFSGNEVPADYTPLAQAYAGHQFGHFNKLGDGRALLLGEIQSPDGQIFDLHLKGSGPTPYSRRGDGRGTLHSMLREYLISEAMHHLGIPSTRTLAVIATGEEVYRPHPLPGGILTRVAHSHIRVGTFEYARHFGTEDDLEALALYTLRRHYPDLLASENPALELLRAVMNRQIELVVHWMRVGFIHGVMNTDNMSISGQTIDFGPCAFMNAYDPATVFSSIDHGGRYAYGNQPAIAHWNLGVLAGALLPLFHPNVKVAIEMAREVLDPFPALFKARWRQMMLNKIGIAEAQTNDSKLVDDLLDLMHKYKADYTQSFLALRQGQSEGETWLLSSEFSQWKKQWEARIAPHREEAMARMDRNNPRLIPRNHLVEEVLAAATTGNLIPFQEMLTALSDPYSDQVIDPKFQQVPDGFDAEYQTFCGT